MPTYIYKARDSSGKVITGSRESKDKNAVYKQLTDENLFIVEVKQKSEKSSFFSLQLKSGKKKKKIKIKNVIVFTRQLYSMLHAGLPLLNSIRVMVTQIKHPTFKEVLSQIADDVKGGASFSKSLNKYPKVFSHRYVSMIEAGEEAGKLDEILNRLVEIMEKEENTKSEIKAAFSYPVIIVFIAVTVVGFLTTFVFPKFIQIFIENKVALPLPTQLLFSFSGLVRNYWYLFIGVFVIFVVSLKKYWDTKRGKYKIDGVILKIPIIGRLIRELNLSRFARTLATLYSSGVPILTALDIVEKSITNLVIRSWINEVRKEVEKGKSLAEPMMRVGSFPPMMVQMIATGEETGAISEMLIEISKAYETEVDYTVKAVTESIEPLLIVFMGIIVGFIALSLFLPMMDMMKMVG